MNSDSGKNNLPKNRPLDETSSSSDDDLDNPQAGSSRPTFNRTKKSTKRRNYRQKDSNVDEADPGGSSVDDNDKPGSSTAFNKLHKRVKRRSYRRSAVDSDEATPPFPHAAKTNFNAGESDSSSEIDNNEECKENSEEWTSTEEEKYLTPLVLMKIKPKHNLSIINEVMQRQIGRGAQFEKKFYGSLHMVERLEYLHSLDEHQGCVNTIEFNAKGDLLVSGSDDLAIIVWNWATGQKCKVYESRHRNNVFQASWLPRDESACMVTCASDGQVRLLDLPTGVSRKLATHRGACNKFTIHPDYPHVAISVGDDGVVQSIDIRESETSVLMKMTDRGFAAQLYGIDSSPRNCNEFCVGGRSDSVKIYDRRKTSAPLSKLCPNNLADNTHVHVTSVTYNYNGTEILASYNDDDIYLFDTLDFHPNGDYAHKYEGHRNSKTIKGVNYFGPKSEFIVSGSDCGNIYFWEKNTEAVVQCIPGESVVNCVKPHPYIPMLASSGLEHDVKIWIPLASEPPAMAELKECVTANLNERVDSQLELRSSQFQSCDISSFCTMLENHLGENSELFTLLSGNRSPETSSDEDEDDDDDE